MRLYQDFNIKDKDPFLFLKSYMSSSSDLIFIVATESLYVSSEVTLVIKTHLNERVFLLFRFHSLVYIHQND